MARFFARTEEDEEIRSDSLIDFNKNALFSDKDVRMIEFEFVGNIGRVYFNEGKLWVNGKYLEDKVRPFKGRKVCFRRKQAGFTQSGKRTNKVMFIGVGWEDENDSNTSILCLSGDGKVFVINER